MTDPTAPRDLTYEERATLQDLYAWSDRLTDDWLGLGERLRGYADAWKADVDELRAEVERLRQYEPLPGGVPLREVLLQREVERLTRELARYAYPPDHRVSMAEAERARVLAIQTKLAKLQSLPELYTSALAAAKLASSGKNGVICSSGWRTHAKGKTGTWVALAEFDDEGRCIGFATGCAGKDFPADTWVRAKDGKLVEIAK